MSETTARETKELKTSGGHVVVFNAYLKAKESNAIRQAIWGSLEIDVSAGKVVGNTSGAVLYQNERETLKYMLVSVDGATDNVLNALDDLPQDEYQEVVAAVNEVSNLKNSSTK